MRPGRQCRIALHGCTCVWAMWHEPVRTPCRLDPPTCCTPTFLLTLGIPLTCHNAFLLQAGGAPSALQRTGLCPQRVSRCQGPPSTGLCSLAGGDLWPRGAQRRGRRARRGRWAGGWEGDSSSVQAADVHCVCMSAARGRCPWKGWRTPEETNCVQSTLTWLHRRRTHLLHKQ